jgi:predicted DNA-binding transcriptional regulator YafY
MSEKFHRVWEILNRLDQREILTPKSLPEDFNVSERTIFRDFEVICYHFPVIFDREAKTYQNFSCFPWYFFFNSFGLRALG